MQIKVFPFKELFRLDKILFLLFLYIPSAGFINKYTGLYGLILLFLFNIIIAAFISSQVEKIKEEKNQKYIVRIFIAFFALLFILFLIIYPIANTKLPGYGSDQDDAINVAVHRLLDFNYPYSARTYLGHLISPLPGALILGTPFVLMASSAIQNFFWFIILSYIFKAEFGVTGLFHLMLLFFLSPALFYLFFVGSDYPANSMYLFTAFWLIKEKILTDKKFTPQHYLILLFTGLAFSSRLNYLVILPILFGFLVKKSDVKYSLKIISLVLFSFLLVTLPFYFYSPGSFSPLHTTYKLTRFNELMPNTDILLIILAALVSVWFSFRSYDFKSFLENVSYALAFPIIATVILFSIQSDGINFYTFFGAMYLIFACHPIIDKILVKRV